MLFTGHVNWPFCAISLVVSNCTPGRQGVDWSSATADLAELRINAIYSKETFNKYPLYLHDVACRASAWTRPSWPTQLIQTT